MRQRQNIKRKVALLFLILVSFTGAGYYLVKNHHGTAVPTAALATNGNASTPSPLQCIAKLPTSFLAGQVLMVGLDAAQMPSQAAVFSQYNIGGAALMTAPANVNNGSINSFKKSAASMNVPPLISTDEEGGAVQRFSVLGVLPSEQQVAATMTPGQAEHMIEAHGKKLKATGIDMVLGPVAGVAPTNGSSPLGTRVFSNNPSTVQQFTLSYVKGWQAASVLPTVKHFPGLGSATGNTDYQTVTTPPLSELKKRDFVPYMGALSKTGTAIMVGNQNVPGWFNGPASLSPLPYQYLRGPLGYKNNLFITDSLGAAAITNVATETQAVVQAIKAGSDIALVVEPPNKGLAQNRALIASLHTAIEQAVQKGNISRPSLENSVLRKLNAQHISACSLAKNS